MKDTEYFDLVKDKDEEILKTYRPNKTRAWWTFALTGILLVLVFACPIVAGFLSTEEGGIGVAIPAIAMLVVFVGFYAIMLGLWLNKTIYAVTNKRILIRTGYIGVDYKSLDFTLLGALTVNVNFLDKILRKNTGSISFGSMASPMVSNNVSKFSFSYIKDPYVEYKEIKAIIDSVKDK